MDNEIGQFVWIQLDFYFSTEWQSAFLIHLRHRCARLHCVLCTFDGDGNASSGDIGCRHFSAGILSTSNGRTIRHQCTRDSTVSAKNSAPVANASTYIDWYLFVFLQRNFRHYTCGHLYSVVLNVGVETFCDRILNGSSTDFDRISVCSFVWCICINYNFLNLPSNSVFPIFDHT